MSQEGGGAADDGAGAYGAVGVSVLLPSTTDATLTLTLGWSFPARTHFGTTMGNEYATVYANSTDAAWGMVAPAAR